MYSKGLDWLENDDPSSGTEGIKESGQDDKGENR